jgi:hypothetical protein
VLLSLLPLVLTLGITLLRYYLKSGLQVLDAGVGREWRMCGLFYDFRVLGTAPWPTFMADADLSLLK